MAELFDFSMAPNERIKDFNHIFTTTLNKFTDTEKPIQRFR